MITQETKGANKVHSIFVLPNGAGFIGSIETNGSSYQFGFLPKTASASKDKVVLKGNVEVKSAGGKRSAKDITATLLATQGNAAGAPPIPASLKPPIPAPPDSPTRTEATGNLSSVGVMYLKLSPLDGRERGVPADLSAVQINVRLFATSEIERKLHWLYSALVETTMGEHKNEQLSADYINAINDILKS